MKRNVMVFEISEIPNAVKINYRNIIRREKYSYQKDALSHAFYYGDEENLYKCNCEKIISLKYEKQNRYIEMTLLTLALNLLRTHHPYEYEIICLYHLNENALSLSDIGRMKNISKQRVHYRLHKAYNYLRKYMTIYKI